MKNSWKWSFLLVSSRMSPKKLNGKNNPSFFFFQKRIVWWLNTSYPFHKRPNSLWCWLSQCYWMSNKGRLFITTSLHIFPSKTIVRLWMKEKGEKNVSSWTKSTEKTSNYRALCCCHCSLALAAFWRSPLLSFGWVIICFEVTLTVPVISPSGWLGEGWWVAYFSRIRKAAGSTSGMWISDSSSARSP